MKMLWLFPISIKHSHNIFLYGNMGFDPIFNEILTALSQGCISNLVTSLCVPLACRMPGKWKQCSSPRRWTLIYSTPRLPALKVGLNQRQYWTALSDTPCKEGFVKDSKRISLEITLSPFLEVLLCIFSLI